MNLNRYKPFIFFALISTIVVIAVQTFIYEPKISVPHSDAFWYIDYSLGLKENNTFGYSKNNYIPSNVIAPLYPAYLSLLLKIDDSLATDFKCLLKHKDNDVCSIDLSSLAWFQCVLAIITFWCIWLAALEIFKSYSVAWISSIVALFMGRILHFANLILTEIMTITLFSLFSLMLIKFINTQKIIWIVLSSSCLALLTLTRPQFHYLFIIIVVSQLLLFLFKRKRLYIKYISIMILIYLSIVGPWMARNHYYFGNTALSSGYGDRVLTTRISYNRMSWQEWAVGFIYWFPDCGDSVARRLFPPEYYEKLSFNHGSYYLDDRGVLPVSERGKTTKEIVNYLIKNEILGNPVKHSLVTVLLFWRGMFIAKYWGVIGFICFLILILRSKTAGCRQLLIMSLPAWFMVFFHAFISLNIARYNLILIPLYSISIAALISQVPTTTKQKLASLYKTK